MGADSLDKSICNGDGDSLSHEVSQDDSLAICAGVAEKRHFNAPRDPCRDFAIRHIIFVSLEGSDWHTSESIKISTAHAAKVALTAFKSDLPQFDVGHKVSGVLNVETYNAATSLPKGSKLLFTTNALLQRSATSTMRG